MADGETDWRSLSDAATRRRIQNRIAQRKYRSNIRNRLKELENQISVTPKRIEYSINTIDTFSAKRRKFLDRRPSNNEHSPAYETSSEGAISRKRLHSDEIAVERATSMSDEDHFRQSFINPFDLSDTSGVLSEDMSPQDAISSIDPNTLMGLPTPRENLDYADFSNVWTDAPDVQETGINACNTIEFDEGRKSTNDRRKLALPTLKTTGPSGYTSLHLAAKKGHKEIIFLLLDRGGDVNDTDLSGQSALHMAAAEGFHEILQVLIEKGAMVALQDAQGQTPLHLAVQNGHEEIVRLLLDHGADPRARVTP